MRKHILVTFLFVSSVIFAQYSNDFSSSSLKDFFGTTTKFEIRDSLLYLNDLSATSANQAYLAVASESIVDATWEIKVHLDFNPSSSNYARFYLISDKADFTADLNGYFVMIGNTADEVSLYCQTGSTKTKIIDGTDKRLDASSVEVSVKVTRSEKGEWKLYSKLSTEEAFVSEGTCTDLTYETAKYSGVLVNYTSSNGKKVWFDDYNISGEKLAPKYEAKFADIAFSELMVKPSPRVSLPEEEYIEIQNLTNEKIDLKGFLLCDASKKYAFPSVTFLPNQILLLCSEKNLSQFEQYGSCIGFSSFPSLTDSGKLLWIEDKNGQTICFVEYSETWNKNAFKSNGGWALECKDLTNFSNNANNWDFSADKRGGTPATINSVAKRNADSISPDVEKFSVVSNKSIKISFSEPMNVQSLSNKSNYEFSNNLKLDTIIIDFPITSGVTLVFTENLPTEIFEVSMKNITDLAGNLLVNQQFKISAISEMSASDIVVNEFLFGQSSANFVEIYNLSNKTLDLSELYICGRTNDELTSGELLATQQTLMFPSEYAVVTTNAEKLCATFSCAESTKIIEIKSFANFDTKGGNIVLVKRNSEVVSEVAYTAEMCEKMTSKTDFASAERTEFTADDWHTSSEVATPGRANSAFVPDEKENEQDETDEENADNLPEMPMGISLQEKSFSPNGDGYRDELKINCRLDESLGYVKIDIYTAEGKKVKTLVGKTEISSPTTFTWDGTDDDNSLSNIGMYLVYVEVQTAKRGIKHYKLPFAITKD